MRLALGLGGRALRDRPGVGVLVYHGLDRRGGSGFNARFLSQRAFERHVLELRARVQIVSLQALARGEFDPRRFALALTFDDGYGSVATLALPLLERYGLPATIFVTAVRATGDDVLWPDVLDLQSHLQRAPIVVAGETFTRDRRGEYRARGDGERLKARCRRASWDYLCAMRGAFPDERAFRARPDLEPYWRLLEVDELRRLARSPLLTIASHGLRHLSLAFQPRDVVRHELRASRAWLQETLQREVDTLAFPDGSFTPENAADARALGYRLLLGADELPPGGAAAHVLRRLTVNPLLSARNQLRCLLAGTYA